MAELRYSKEQVREALEKTFGVKAAAAARLGCCRQTIDNYISRFPELEQVVEYQRERLVDAAEVALMKRIQQGSDSSIRYVLESFGRKRGWGRSQSDEQQRLTEEPGPVMQLPGDGYASRRRDGARPTRSGAVALTYDDDDEDE